jgi:hypothetical protein
MPVLASGLVPVGGWRPADDVGRSHPDVRIEGLLPIREPVPVKSTLANDDPDPIELSSRAST